MPSRTPKSPEGDEELARLRAKVAELEAELARQEREKGDRAKVDTRIRELTDTMRETTTRGVDESAKLFRGVTLASLEKVRAASDVIAAFVDSVYEQNRLEQEDSVGALARRLPADLTGGFFDAMERAFDIPNRRAAF